MNKTQRITIGTVDELLAKRIMSFPESSLGRYPVKDITSNESG